MKKKVLFVDDSKSIRQAVSFMLQNAGYEVVLAEDGLDGLKKASNSSFHVVLTDLHMPNLNGIEFIKKLRKMDEFRFTPILFLTTETLAHMKEEAKAAGATGWITKPFDNDKLLKILSRVIR